MDVVLIIIGSVLIGGTLLSLLRLDDWWVRIFDFPRLQIAIALAATLLGHYWMQRSSGAAAHAFSMALAVCCAYQSYRMLPYTRLFPKQVQPARNATSGSTITLLFANVLQTNRNASRLRAIITEQDPDIVLAVETDAWWDEQLAYLRQTHPRVVRQPQDNTYGMVLYSRLELRNAQVKFLVQQDVPSIHAEVLLRCGQQLLLRCLHPRPPAPQENDRSTERDAELLIVGREIKQKQQPAIVLGDLNDVAWSRTNDLFHAISGLLDPRVGRGFFHTFNARWPLIRFPLDHVFHSRHFRLIRFRRLPYFGSDHFPVSIALSYEPQAVAEQEQPASTPEDQQEATEKIAQARE